MLSGVTSCWPDDPLLSVSFEALGTLSFDPFCPLLLSCDTGNGITIWWSSLLKTKLSLQFWAREDLDNPDGDLWVSRIKELS